MFVMLRRFESQAPPQQHKIQDNLQVFLRMRLLLSTIRTCQHLQSKLTYHNPYLNSTILKLPSLKKSSVRLDKENKDKVDELDSQLKKIKGTHSLGSVNFSDLCIYPPLKFCTNFKFLT